MNDKTLIARKGINKNGKDYYAVIAKTNGYASVLTFDKTAFARLLDKRYNELAELDYGDYIIMKGE